MKGYKRSVFLLWLGFFAAILLSATLRFHEFGSPESGMIQTFTEGGESEIGSPNTVNAIVWGFRGYDTLGEELVLFAAAMGVWILALHDPDPKEIERDRGSEL